MNRKYIYILTFILTFFSFTFLNQAEASPFDEAKSIIEDLYVGNINGDLNNAQTIEELVGMLDPYSDYFTYDEYVALFNTINQENVGIGVVVEKTEEGILINSVIENGSAYNSGIKAQEIITHVNGTSMKGYSVEDATALIKGPEGTSVTLTIKRTDGLTYTKTLIRKAFSIPTVTSNLLYGNIGYIALSSFSANGAYEVKNAAIKLQQQGAQSFIIDLQNNTGGIVTTAQQLISLFPNTKIAYLEKTKAGIVSQRTIDLKYKLPGTSRLLINGMSASASEMTAQALKDQGAAILYGERSYGKGTVQGFYNLSDNSILKITQAEFLGPNKTTINKVGVEPDFKTTTAALYTAHFDAIKEKYPTYKPLKTFTNVSTDKTFTITFNEAVTDALPEDAIDLVMLGGTSVDIDVQKNDAQLVITPVEPLIKGKEYMLIIHPDKVKNIKNNKLKNGYYSYITVQK